MHVNYRRSAESIDKMASAVMAGQLIWNYAGRDGRPTVTAHQWAKILGVAARRLRDCEIHPPRAELRIRSARRLLKLARKIRNGSVTIHTPFTCTANRLVVAAQRLLS